MMFNATMKKILLLLLCFLTVSPFVFSDRARYNKTARIILESKNYVITHYHDWSENYAYIECVQKNTHGAVFNVPSPALTNLFVSEDEKYIVGLSKIKAGNPYQVIIVNIKGEYVLRRHISRCEAKLNQSTFKNFIEEYSEQHVLLESLNRIYNVGTYYFVDFLDCYQSIGEDAWNYLRAYLSENHLSSNIHESVTNYIFWFNEPNAGLEYIYKNNELSGISLLDTKNRKIIITINE